MIIKPSSRLDQVQTYYFAKKLGQIESLNKNGPTVINLGIGSPDLAPPASVINKLGEKIRKEKANMYQSYRGIPELRNAFADWYLTKMCVPLDPDSEILPLIGSKEGIMHISMSFLEPGDQVLVPNPGYPAYRMTTLLAGAKPVEYDLKEQNGWLPDLNFLSKTDLSKVKLMWINYPHMPTGANATHSFFRELLSFAKSHCILICHDNPYSFILNNNPLSILSIEGAKRYSIELNSLSKSFNMAGWRVGVMCSDSKYIDTVLKFKSNMDSGMFRPIQEAAAIALQKDPKWYSKLNRTYSKRRVNAWRLLDLLECKYDKTSSGLFVWGKVPQRINNAEEWMEQILIEARVFITPGIIFGSNGSRYIRISLCNPEDIFDRACQRIKQVLQPLNMGL